MRPVRFGIVTFEPGELAIPTDVKRNSPRAVALAIALPLLLSAPAALAQPLVEPTPAQAADPPPIPAPGSQTPISSSGTDVAPPGPTLGAALLPAADAPLGDARRRDLDTRLALDDARLKTLEDDLGPLRHLKVQGYVQFQYRL